MNFINFESIISDSSHFKLFYRSDEYYIYNDDISLVDGCIMVKDVVIRRELRELKISKCVVDSIIRYVLVDKKISICEYVEDGDGYVVSRRGYPGNWLDFGDIISDELSPAMGCVVVKGECVFLSFASDRNVLVVNFMDDDIFTNLFYIINENNITEIIINDKSYERVLINMGVIVHIRHKKNLVVKNNRNVDEMLSISLLVEFLNLKEYNILEYKLKEIMKLDVNTLNSLDIFGNEKSVCSLFKCKTNQGKRLLKQYFKQPLKNEEEIYLRVMFSELFANVELSDVFSKCVDFVRISKRIDSCRVSMHEIVKMYYTIKLIPEIVHRVLVGLELEDICTLDKNIVQEKVFSELIQPLKGLEGNFSGVITEIERFIDLDKTEYNEYVLRRDISVEIDALLEAREDIFVQVKELHKKILKVNKKVKLECVADIFNFKLTRLEYSSIENIFKKQGYIQKSVLRGGVVFTSFDLEELNKKLEDNLVEYRKLERKIKNELILILKGYLAPLDAYNYLIAIMDVYSAFSVRVKDPEYSKPVFTKRFILKNSFHPLLMGKDECIKNDIELVENKFVVITGPNMGGKSTFLKQCAVINILAQIGAYVPAEYCEVSILDGIFIRIGASDCASMHISTFMNEMLDIGNICRMATADSMVIIDELGRGTGAKDGLALALAVSENLIEKGCITLFATHFPEICGLNSVNKRVKTIIDNDNITMLYKLEDGVCNTSFGIHVAKVVGFPQEVINDALEYLNK